MEIALRARQTLIAALLVVGTAASAEPQKAPARPAPQPTKIVMASADPVRSHGPTSAKPAAPAKRTGRVATCRCGGDALLTPKTTDQ